MAKPPNISAATIRSFKTSVDSFKSAVSQLTKTGADSFVRIFEKAVNKLDKTISEKFKKVDENFNSSLKKNIENLANVKIKIDPKSLTPNQITPKNVPPPLPPRTEPAGTPDDDGENNRGRGRERDRGDDGEDRSRFGTFDILRSIGVYSLVGSITQLKNELDDIKVSLLGFNTDITKFQSFLGTSIEGLRGSTLENLKNATILYSEGFRGNNKGLLTVASRLSLTNQSTEKLLREFPQLSMTLGLSTQEMNKFAVKLDNNAKQYGISIDKLIDSLQSLKIVEDIGIFMDALGGNFKDAFAELTAQYPAQAKAIGDFLNKLYSSQEAYAMIVAKGGQKFITQLESATTGADLTTAMMGLARISRETGIDFTNQARAVQGSISGFRVLNDLNEAYGDGIIGLGAKVDKSMLGQKTAVDATAKANQEFTKSLTAAMKEFQSLFVPIMSKFLTVLTDVMSFLNSFGQVTIGVIVIGAMVNLSKTIISVIVGLHRLGAALNNEATQATARAVRGAAASVAGGVAGAAAPAAAAVAAGAAARAATGAAAGAVARGLGVRLLGFLGGPWGIAITTILSILTMWWGNSKDSSQEAIKNSRKQTDLQEKSLELNRVKTSPQEQPDIYESVYKSMNRDLMYTVTSMRLDAMRTNELFNKLIDSSNRTADEMRRLRSGDFTVPSRSR